LEQKLVVAGNKPDKFGSEAAFFHFGLVVAKDG
jgi:hypothetical protein